MHEPWTFAEPPPRLRRTPRSPARQKLHWNTPLSRTAGISSPAPLDAKHVATLQLVLVVTDAHLEPICAPARAVLEAVVCHTESSRHTPEHPMPGACWGQMAQRDRGSFGARMQASNASDLQPSSPSQTHSPMCCISSTRANFCTGIFGQLQHDVPIVVAAVRSTFRL